MDFAGRPEDDFRLPGGFFSGGKTRAVAIGDPKSGLTEKIRAARLGP